MAKRRNPGSLMLLENPYSFDYLGNLHPRRKHRRTTMRNPLDTTLGIGKYTQGVSLMDSGAALIGFMAAGYVPGLIVKDTSTTTKKLLKVVTALGTTVATGYALKKMSPSAAKMAVVGGMAGTLVVALGTFTNIKLPGLSGVGVRPTPQIPFGSGIRGISGMGRVNEPEFTGTKLR